MSYRSKKMWAQYLRQIKECEEKIERWGKDARMYCWWSTLGRPADNTPEYKLIELYVREGKTRWHLTEAKHTGISEEEWRGLVERKVITKMVILFYATDDCGDEEFWRGPEKDVPEDPESAYDSSHSAALAHFDPERVYMISYFTLNVPNWREPPEGV